MTNFHRPSGFRKMLPVLPSMPKPGSYLLLPSSHSVGFIHEKPTIPELHKALGCDCLDTVNLKNGYVMMVDDVGAPVTLPDAPPGKNLPVNELASAMVNFYRKTEGYIIYGPAVVVWDLDFEEPEK